MASKSDVINDIGGAHDPSFVAVAICVGSDMDSEPVTLVDRLCLNRPAVELIKGDMEICQQEASAFRSELAQCQSNLKDMTRSRDIWMGAEFFMFTLCMVLLAVLFKKAPR